MVATIHSTPRGNPRILLKAGFSPEKGIMGVADLDAEAQTPSSRSDRFKLSDSPNANGLLAVSLPQHSSANFELSPQKQLPPNITHDPANKVFIQDLSNGGASLFDLTWPLTTGLPLKTLSNVSAMESDAPPHIFPLRIIIDGVAKDFALTSETLCSTPSDFRSILTEPGFIPKEDQKGCVLTSLRIFGLEREHSVRIILGFMQSGRFNSGVFTNNVLREDGKEEGEAKWLYGLDKCIDVLELASRYAMTRVVDLVLLEMSREFISSTTPLDISARQLDQLSKVYDPKVWKWLHEYLLPLFRTAKSVREYAKNQVEVCIVSQAREHTSCSQTQKLAEAGAAETVGAGEEPSSGSGAGGGGGRGGSMLQRIIWHWFTNNPNPMRNKREGELARLRAMRGTRYGPQKNKRGSVVSSVAGSSRLGSVVSDSAATETTSAAGTSTPGETQGGSFENGMSTGRGRERLRKESSNPAAMVTPTSDRSNGMMVPTNTPVTPNMQARSLSERGTLFIKPPSSMTLGGSPLKKQVLWDDMDIDVDDETVTECHDTDTRCDETRAGVRNEEEGNLCDSKGMEALAEDVGIADANAEKEDDDGWEDDLERQRKERISLNPLLLSHLPL